MTRLPAILAFAVAAFLAAGASVAAAGSTTSDPYTCIRAKDLKMASAVTVTPNPTFVGVTQGGGSGDCNLRKISLVCLPSSVNAQVPVATVDAKCCFRSKCDSAIGNFSNVAITDDGGGAGTFSTNVSMRRATLTCLPCTFTPQ